FSDQSFSNSANIIEWFWDFGDGRTSSQQNPLVTYSKGGYYNVRLRVLTSDDCSSVILKNDFIHAISTTTIQEADNFEIAIFPNPANDYVVVKLKHDALEMQSISLYNSLGQKVQFYTDINDQEFVINSLHDLSGMLHMKIDLSNGESVYAKLIVE
ncbi:MAG: T9SS type A sorting domain-containing protein, partial [Bacteroidetes bacterium]|nr:T9SS type A sorting domain-containing protein [Bacteroidota bacterium]